MPSWCVGRYRSGDFDRQASERNVSLDQFLCMCRRNVFCISETCVLSEKYGVCVRETCWLCQKMCCGCGRNMFCVSQKCVLFVREMCCVCQRNVLCVSEKCAACVREMCSACQRKVVCVSGKCVLRVKEMWCVRLRNVVCMSQKCGVYVTEMCSVCQRSVLCVVTEISCVWFFSPTKHISLIYRTRIQNTFLRYTEHIYRTHSSDTFLRNILCVILFCVSEKCVVCVTEVCCVCHRNILFVVREYTHSFDREYRALLIENTYFSEISCAWFVSIDQCAIKAMCCVCERNVLRVPQECVL